MENKNEIILLIFILVAFDVFVWWQILFNGPNKNTELYFLDVGQGDAELVVLPGGVKILIDGGPNNKILSQFKSIFSPFNRYIDLVILSHPQKDHFAGLIDVLKRYQAGIFISNGQKEDTQSFSDLERTINENKIKIINLAEGDKIRYQDNYLDILSPSKDLLLKNDTNDAGLMIRLNAQGASALFTADIDSKIEEELIKKYNLDVDILKVAHHGSKYSSSENFLINTSPKIAIIEVGKNSYGHPAKEVLNKLLSIGAQVFRTDQDGTIKLIINPSQINILKKK
jgi:competence protein ComEC